MWKALKVGMCICPYVHAGFANRRWLRTYICLRDCRTDNESNVSACGLVSLWPGNHTYGQTRGKILGEEFKNERLETATGGLVVLKRLAVLGQERKLLFPLAKGIYANPLGSLTNLSTPCHKMLSYFT